VQANHPQLLKKNGLEWASSISKAPNLSQNGTTQVNAMSQLFTDMPCYLYLGLNFKKHGISYIYFIGEFNWLDVMNNHQNELSDSDEDYLPSYGTSFTVDVNNDYNENVDNDARYQNYFTHSELTEGLSNPNYRKWLVEMKRNSD
jgi:hypothetical protein